MCKNNVFHHTHLESKFYKNLKGMKIPFTFLLYTKKIILYNNSAHISYIYISNTRDSLFAIVYVVYVVGLCYNIHIVCFFDGLNWKQEVSDEAALPPPPNEEFLGCESNALVLLLRASTEIYVKHWRYVIQTFSSFIITEETLQLRTQVDNLW